MFDYFVAALQCPHCGAISDADSSTDLQTHLRNDASGIEIAVGFQLEPGEARRSNIVSSGYLLIGDEAASENVRLLDTWRCPTCGRESWARTTLTGTQVSAIEAVVLDRAELSKAQFISDQCFMLAAQVSGLPAKDLMEGKIDPVRTLLERLP